VNILGRFESEVRQCLPTAAAVELSKSRCRAGMPTGWWRASPRSRLVGPILGSS